MKKLWSSVAITALSALTLAACGTNESSNASEAEGNYTEDLTIVWYPNESGTDMESSRDAIGAYIEEATGKEVHHELTTDYAIAIESIANGNGNLSFMGAQGYVEANASNEAVQPLVVPSGESGTLEDAVYYSWLNVKKGNEGEYADGDSYSIDNIQDKRMSFVSNSSTSGFVVPVSSIQTAFPDLELTQEDLMEGGDDKLFSEVLFGGSHQGSAVNLLQDRADVAAFNDTSLMNYVEPVEGEMNEVGTTYEVIEGAADPFSTMAGEQFVAISVTPVLNAPMVMNTEVTSPEDQEALLEVFTSEEMNNDPAIWKPADSEGSALFEKAGDSQFVEVKDAWFDPIRELSN